MKNTKKFLRYKRYLSQWEESHSISVEQITIQTFKYMYEHLRFDPQTWEPGLV